jgi:hypothetical protein
VPGDPDGDPAHRHVLDLEAAVLVGLERQVWLRIVETDVAAVSADVPLCKRPETAPLVLLLPEPTLDATDTGRAVEVKGTEVEVSAGEVEHPASLWEALPLEHELVAVRPYVVEPERAVGARACFEGGELAVEIPRG